MFFCSCEFEVIQPFKPLAPKGAVGMWPFLLCTGGGIATTSWVLAQVMVKCRTSVVLTFSSDLAFP